MLQKKGSVIWFTGLSGAGKTTLAELVAEKLRLLNYKCFILDGDEIRKGLNKDLKFTDEDRTENNRRIAEVARLLSESGLIVIVSCISPFKRDRQSSRHICKNVNFFEIYIDCPLEICEKRDIKGLYDKARKGLIKNFTGIGSSYEIPPTPDLTIQTGICDVKDSFKKLFDFIINALKDVTT